MEEIDDDFGDLYVDVEAQAINGGRNFTRLYTEPDEQEEEDDNNDSDSNRTIPNPNPDPSSENDDESDSEDDLNIVLNDEDCEYKTKTFPIENRLVDMKTDEDEDGFVASKKEEEKVKYIRTHGLSIPSDVKANACSSLLARCDWKYNVRDRRKGPSSDHSDLVGATRNSVMTQNRCGFSLPWYRSILDANIDTFEEKPWRYPGVDITDFFNFGFNEDSWRQYCNSLEQYRRSSFAGLGNSNHVPRNQDCEAGLKHDEQVEKTMVGNIDQPKGRAIQVEDGSGERQPSVHVWRPRDRDSDVVIQITLEDPIDDTSDTGEKLNHSSSTQCETSNKEGFDASDCNDGRGDEFSVESLEKFDKKADRCYAKTTASNPMTNDADDTEKKQSPDVDENHHEGACAFSSDGTTKLPESVNEKRESIILKPCTADQYMVEMELSLEEEDQLSLNSSCFEGDSEVSIHDSHLDHRKVTSPIRRSSVKSGAELWDSDTSIPKNLRGSYAEIKPVDYKDYSKCKSPVQGGRNHWTRSVDSLAQRKINISDNDASPELDAEDRYDKGHLSADCGRWKAKVEDVSFTDREDLACYEKSKWYHYNVSREFAKEHTRTAWKNYRKRSQVFHEERDPYLIENWKEREPFCEDERREGYQYQRGPFPRDMSLFKETGQLVSRYSAATEELDFQSKRRNKLQFMKPTNHGSWLPDYQLDDTDFMQEKYERSVSLINRRRDTLDESYVRQVPKRCKKVKNLGWKRYNDAFSLELEGSWSREIEDEYWRKADAHCLSHHSNRESDEERWAELEGSWSRKIEDDYLRNTDVHHLSHHSYRESDGGRWTDPMPSRNGISRSRFVERYRRQLPAGEGKESGWLENYYDSSKFEDGFIYPNDGVYFRKKRCGWKSKVLPWTEKELTVRHRDEKLKFEKSSFFCKNDGRHWRNQCTHGSLHDASNTRCIYRSRKMYRAKNEQAVLMCGDLVDLFVGKGKLSRRRLEGRNLNCNSRLEDTNPEDFVESSRYKAVQSGLLKTGLNRRNEDFHDRFSLVAQNEDFDIEEGQIVTEEPCMGPLESTLDSASAAHSQSVKKRMLEDDLASNGSKTRAECDNQRILETLAKMERRRKRFKEPIAFKREHNKCAKPDIVPSCTIIETPETKQPRPARKRQWCTGQGS